MNPDSAAHTFVAIPELAFLLFSWLSLHDLTQCIRVCKQWMHLAEPVLWKNFCQEQQQLRLACETTAGLIRNLPHIRIVELSVHEHAVLQGLAQGATPTSQPDNAAVDLGTPCTHLRRLTLDDHNPFLYEAELFKFSNTRSSSFTLPTIVALLNHNLCLTHLTFPLPDVETDDPVLIAISNLKGLRYLAVSSGERSDMSSWSLSLLLQACLPLPELKELYIKSCVDWVGYACDIKVPDIKTIIKEAAIARFSQTPTPGRIRALHVPFRPESRENSLALAFLKSDLLDLQSFTIPAFHDDWHPGNVEQLVQERCPNLKHLKCTDYKRFHDKYRDMRSFIRGCSGLRSFASDGFEDQIYQGGNGSYESRCIVSDLVSHHCDTLQDFELKNCGQVSSSDLQELLSRCKQLKRFHVSGNFPETRDGRHQDGDAGFDTEDAHNGAWACTELRDLWITLGRTSLHTENYFYQQIGRLEKLERLTLDIHRRKSTMVDEWGYYLKYTLSMDSLGEMANLTNLESLRLAAELCVEMCQTEIEFIHEDWPLLREITIMGSMGSRFYATQHWHWLFKKRPHLRFIVLEDHHMTRAMESL
ncbi:hypothetical protein BGZ72_011141 [Mortierella alpina]|nr:hypothetical protein BGZ72_011141 [Mortierella alpina]